MTKFEQRQPETPEEIKVARQEKQIRAITMTISMVFYIAIFLSVPKVPNSDFYLMLDSFLNSYCLGDVMPSFSPDFHFAMKAAWCLSLPYSLFLVLMFAFIIHTQLGIEGVRISLKIYNATKKVRIILFLMTLWIIFLGFWLSILYYAFGTYTALSIGKGLNAIFHGNLFQSAVLFLFLHKFFVRGGIYFALLQIYFFIFCKGDLTDDN